MKQISIPRLKDPVRKLISAVWDAHRNSGIVQLADFIALIPDATTHFKAGQLEKLKTRSLAFRESRFSGAGIEKFTLEAGKADIKIPKLLGGGYVSLETQCRLRFEEGQDGSGQELERMKVGKLFWFWKFEELFATWDSLTLDLEGSDKDYLITF